MDTLDSYRRRQEMLKQISNNTTINEEINQEYLKEILSSKVDENLIQTTERIMDNHYKFYSN